MVKLLLLIDYCAIEYIGLRWHFSLIVVLLIRGINVIVICSLLLFIGHNLREHYVDPAVVDSAL